jgi:DDE superfamily endonuclease
LQHVTAGKETAVLDTLPRAGQLQTILDSGAALGAAAQPPDPARVADAVARYRAYQALREFRLKLYECLTARADALFELCDAILCADHAVTSLVQLSLEAEFTRGHGALYDALAAGRIDEEKLAALLAGTLPQLIDGAEGRDWISGHDVIDHGLLEQALAGVPAVQAVQVREACARWRRLRFAIDATPYPRPDAGCSPGREHVHHDACRCDGTRKTIPGWEYQFAAAVGHLRTAWTALVDVERTTKAARTNQTARQVRNLLRRLGAAGRGAPLVILDAGYSAAALTAALAGQPVHLLVRLPSGSVLYGDPVTWPGRNGRPPRHGIPVTCHNDPGAANPEPEESLTLPDTPHYGTVRADAWYPVHPVIHGDRGWFKDNWHGQLPVLRGTLLRVTVERLPDGRRPHKTMWLWHAGPARLSPDELWRAYLARFRRRAHLPVPQRRPRAHHRQGPHSRAGRPVGPPRHGRLRPAAARPPAGLRPAPRLGKTTRPLPAAHPQPGPPRVSQHPAPDRHPRPCRKTLCPRPRTPQRHHPRSRTPAPDPKEKPRTGHITPHPREGHGLKAELSECLINAQVPGGGGAVPRLAACWGG